MRKLLGTVGSIVVAGGLLAAPGWAGVTPTSTTTSTTGPPATTTTTGPPATIEPWLYVGFSAAVGPAAPADGGCTISPDAHVESLSWCHLLENEGGGDLNFVSVEQVITVDGDVFGPEPDPAAPGFVLQVGEPQNIFSVTAIAIPILCADDEQDTLVDREVPVSIDVTWTFESDTGLEVVESASSEFTWRQSQVLCIPLVDTPPSFTG